MNVDTLKKLIIGVCLLFIFWNMKVRMDQLQKQIDDNYYWDRCHHTEYLYEKYPDEDFYKEAYWKNCWDLDINELPKKSPA